jgi:hypothetical protein
MSTDILISYGVDPSMAGSLFNEVIVLGERMGIAVALKQETDKLLVIHHVLTGSRVCGHFGVPNTKISPICKTEISEHRFAEIMMEFMTDGTPASIAPKELSL